MAQPNPSDVDDAVMTLLSSDQPLLTLMPGNVYWDLPPQGIKQFVVVSLVEGLDVPMFQGRAFEEYLYAIKVVEQSNVPTKNTNAAFARLDQLLDPQPPLPRPALAIPGYSLKLIRREKRFRITERDEVDRSIMWIHRVGYYRVVVAPLGTT